MGLLTGILSCVIAAVKGRKTFAIITGVWTGIALIVALSGAPQYAVAPGMVFLVIAISMKKEAGETVDSIAELDADKKTLPEVQRLLQVRRFESLVGEENRSIPRILKPCKSIDDIIKEVGKFSLPYPLLFSDSFLSSMREYLQTQDTGNIQNLRAAAEKYIKGLFAEIKKNADQILNSPATNSGNESDQGKESSLGKITVDPPDGQTQIMNIEPSSLEALQNKNSARKGNLCPTCGKPLRENVKFCPYCRTKVNNIAAEHTQDKGISSHVSDPNKVFCRSCGKEIEADTSFCRFCGAPVISGPIAHNESEPAEPFPNQKLKLDFSILPATLRRAFLFIEDEEWDRAHDYLERVLDAEPENAYAYLGQALVACKIDSVFFPTAEESAAIKKTRSYLRAMQFADPNTREVFEKWISGGIEK